VHGGVARGADASSEVVSAGGLRGGGALSSIVGGEGPPPQGVDMPDVGSVAASRLSVASSGDNTASS
jgi:hypothetical protein